MTADVTDLRAFYDSPLGGIAARLVGRVLGRMWDNRRGLSLLGLGYPPPYLPAIAEGCERVLAFMPAAQGVMRWPREGPSAAALADPLTLPLPDGCIDRVLIVHALEISEDPAELLSEAARILSPVGRVILVCPNRSGLWARMDTTPFGQGQPFSRGQLRNLLRRTRLAPERWAEALYPPPLSSPLVLQGAGIWERVGVGLSLPFAGLHVVEASRQWHRPIPVRERRRDRRMRPSLVPVPASLAAARPFGPLCRTPAPPPALAI